MMKKIFLISLTFVFVALQSATAQKTTCNNEDLLACCQDTSAQKLGDKYNQNARHKARQMFEQKKREHFTNVMELSKEEIDIFWPVYNQYDRKRRMLGRERNQILRAFDEKKQSITDAEAKEMNAKILDLQKREYELTVEYTRIFESTLSPRKAFLLNKAETDFQRGLLKSMSKDQNNHNKRNVKPNSGT